MEAPPVDGERNVLPHNRCDIEDDDNLLRYINPYNQIIWDDNLKCHRVSSGAFSESSTSNGGMSVDHERWMLEDGLQIDSQAPGPDWGIAVLYQAT